MVKTVLGRKPKRIWNLNQLSVSDTLAGIPKAEYWENKKGNKFIRIGLDYGHATCTIYFLIFDFPQQKLLNSKFHNSFELVKFYREANGIPVDDNITQLHDINWSDIIDWLNSLLVVKIEVVSKSMNGYNNLRFVGFTNDSLTEFVNIGKDIL